MTRLRMNEGNRHWRILPLAFYSDSTHASS